MRVLTYNLLAGESDDDERFTQATSLLVAAQPEVLGLNECTLLAQGEGARMRGLEAALGMQGVLALAPSGFHVALLVRGAVIEHVERSDSGLSHAALICRLRLGSRELQVVVTHLDPFSAEKRLQEVELLVSRLQADTPSLLLGDLNALSPHDVGAAQPETWVERYRTRHLDASGAIDTRALRLLAQHELFDVHAQFVPTRPTRPTERYARQDRPLQRLDYIFASSELARTATACAPFDHPHAQTASDHLPLYADFSWP